MSDDGFVREARESVRRLSGGLVELERADRDPETVDELFRTAHGLKGLLAMEGYDDASDVAHALEDFLGAVRREELAVEPGVVDRALDATDRLADAIADVARQGTVDAGTALEPAATALRESIREAGGTIQRGSAADDAGGSGDGTGAGGVTTGEAEGSPGPGEGDGLEAAGVTIADELADAPDVDPGDDVLSAEEALAAAAAFDDLDALVEEIDDAGEFAGLEGGGSFDDLGGGAEPGDAIPAEPDDPRTAFAGLRDSVDEADVDELQRELAAVEFGEFDDDDDVTIDELLGADTDPEGADGDLSQWLVDADLDAADDREPPTDDLAADEFPPGVTVADELRETAETAETDGRADPGDVDGPTDAASTTGPSGRDAPPTGADGPGSATTAGTDAPDPDDGDDRGDATTGGFGGTGFEAAVSADRSGAGTDAAGAGSAGDADASDDEGGSGHADASDDEDAALEQVLSVMTGDPDRDAEPDDAGPADSGDPVDRAPPAGMDLDVTAEASTEDLPSERSPGVDADDAPGDGDGLDVAPDDVVPTLDDVDTGDAIGEDASVAFDRDAAVAAFEERFGEVPTDDESDETPASERTATTVAGSAFAGRIDRPTADEPRLARDDDLGALRVDVENADELLRLAEEIEVARLRLRGELADLPPAAEELFETLAARTGDLRRSVMDVRLMALSSVTDRLPRVARDAARSEDKEVAVTVEGDGVTLDRSVVDRIGDPLTHLVRNAVSHGIEPPAEREAVGKPPEGTVEVRARRRGDDVVVEVRDDGRGIDVDDVRREAVERGLVGEAAAASLSRRAAFDLLFEPGFSTAEAVTGVSGRGVGMDAVRDAVSALDGSVDLKSTPGEGTTVRLELPVTVAMAELLFVDAGGETFALPAADVDGVGRLGADEPAGRAALADGGRDRPARDRGADVDAADGTGDDDGTDTDTDTGEGDGATDADDAGPELIDLRAALDAPPASSPPSAGERAGVRVTRDGATVVLACDRVRDAREAVVDPYDDLLSDVPGVSGTTVSSDGRIVNVIDTETL
jgi:two-component system chemotaxis sensor kinase CheA